VIGTHLDKPGETQHENIQRVNNTTHEASRQSMHGTQQAGVTVDVSGNGMTKE